jgi:hypothetical protein
VRDSHPHTPARLTGSPCSEPQSYFVSAGKLIAGNPRQTVWIEFESPDGQFCVGLWTSETGEWKVSYTEQEYCRILEGRSILTDASGSSQEFGPGDEFVVPAGFQGTWRVEEATRKRFVIFEQGTKPPASDAGDA